MTKLPDKAPDRTVAASPASATTTAVPAGSRALEAPLPAPRRVERRTASRSNIALPVMCRYESVLDFVATQSMNISESGMFIVTETPAPVGSRIDFDFSLADGFTLLHGSAEVARVVTAGPINGMGVRFVDLDAANRALIARIVEVNSQEGRTSTMNFDFARPTPPPPDGLSRQPEEPSPAPLSLPGAASPPPLSVAALRPIHFQGRSLRLLLGPGTAPFFTQNPLLNVRSGGVFIPAEEDVPLGTIYQVEIVDSAGAMIVSGKGKVVAKQNMRIGVRLTDVDKDGMARLRSEVEKLGSFK